MFCSAKLRAPALRALIYCRESVLERVLVIGWPDRPLIPAMMLYLCWTVWDSKDGMDGKISIYSVFCNSPFVSLGRGTIRLFSPSLSFKAEAKP
jgi:hypothetical protein